MYAFKRLCSLIRYTAKEREDAQERNFVLLMFTFEKNKNKKKYHVHVREKQSRLYLKLLIIELLKALTWNTVAT